MQWILDESSSPEQVIVPVLWPATGPGLQTDNPGVGWAGVLVGQRILLHCDDNPDEALLLARALRRSGLADWVIESVASGPEALERLKRAQRGEIPMPDLIALDIRMPKMNGFEVLERLTFNRLKVPPVMLTTSDDVKDRLRAKDMGSRGYFVKSAAYDDFIELLKSWEASPLSQEH